MYCLDCTVISARPLRFNDFAINEIVFIVYFQANDFLKELPCFNKDNFSRFNSDDIGKTVVSSNIMA